MEMVYAESGKVIAWGVDRSKLKPVKKGKSFEKLIWVLAFLVSSSLCGFQLYITLKRYFDKPVVTCVKIDRVNTFKIPKFVICPTFRNCVEKLCDEAAEASDSDGRAEDESFTDTSFVDRLKIKVDEKIDNFDENVTNSGFSAPEPVQITNNIASVWNDSQIKNISCNPKCGFAVNKSECLNNKRNNILLTQNMTERATLIGGNCAIVTQAGEFYYNQRSKNLKFEIQLADSNYSILAIDFYDNLKSVIYDTPFQSTLISYDYAVEIHSIRKFTHLNTNGNPCVTDEEVRSCTHLWIEQQLEAQNFCQLPMLNASRHPIECITLNEFSSNYSILYKWFLEDNFPRCTRSCEENLISFTVKKKIENSSNEIEIELVNNVVEEIRQEYAYGTASMLSDVAGNLGFFLGVSLINVVTAPIILLKKRLF